MHKLKFIYDQNLVKICLFNIKRKLNLVKRRNIDVDSELLYEKNYFYRMVN